MTEIWGMKYNQDMLVEQNRKIMIILTHVSYTLYKDYNIIITCTHVHQWKRWCEMIGSITCEIMQYIIKI